MYQNYKPVHSDFIIHWTGKDIDLEYDNKWTRNHSSSTNAISTQKYLQRLKNILKYGLWMTENHDDEYIKTYKGEIKCPIHSRTCFTELKLSMARSHAAEFGRLGIGFKRFFLFDRIGAPMLYFSEHRWNWFQPPLFDNHNISNDDYYTCFFKSMTQKANDSTLQYKFFDESEWRIIYSNSIKNKLVKIGLDHINSHFINFEDIKEPEFIDYCNDSKIKPKFLIPVQDKWFAMIIYPSIEVKVKAQSDNDIKNLINSFKKLYESNMDKYTNVNKPAPWEPFNYPIEIDLDTCRNF